MRFKGEGTLRDAMGRVICDFSNGIFDTEDKKTIWLLERKGYEAIVDSVKTAPKEKTNGV